MVARARKQAGDDLFIGHLARATGYTDKTLRYYGDIGLLPPKGRTPAGYRLYGQEAIERLRFVRNAQNLGMSLNDIRQILRITDAGGIPCEHVLSVVGRELHHIASQLEVLIALQSQLRAVKRRVTRELAAGPPKGGAGCGCLHDGGRANRAKRPSRRSG